MSYWYVRNGSVAKYRGQQPDWKEAVLVIAASREEALVKARQFREGLRERVETMRKGKTVTAII